MTDNKNTPSPESQESPAWPARFAALIARARRHWPLAAMLAAMVLLAALIRPDAAFGLFRIEPPRQTTYSDQMDTDEQLRRDAAVEGDIVIRDGVAGLAPGAGYRITYSFEREPDERVFLMLRHFWRPYLTTQVLFVTEGGQPAGAQNMNLLGSPPIDVTPYLGQARRFQIVLVAQAAPDAPVEFAPVFDSIVLRRTSDVALPALPPLVFALVIALAAFHGTGREKFRARLPHPAARHSGAVILFAVLVIASRFANVTQVYLWLSVAALALLWLVEGPAPFRKFKPPLSLELITLALIMGIALTMRWAALPAESGKQIEPDAQGYIAIARAMAGPFQTGAREPALIWWVWLARKLFVDHEVALRLMSCLQAVAIVALTWLIGRRVMPGPLALAAALLVAVGQGFIAENLRGLRLEGYIIALQILALALLWMPRRPGPMWIAGAGAAAGYVALSNISALSFCVPLLAWFGLRRRWRWYWWPLPFAILFALPAPYLLYCKQKFGDAFHHSTVYAVFYRNMEFKGQPGYPTVEDVNRDSYTGPKLTTGEYLFKHHTLGEIVGRTARGFLRIYAVSPEMRPSAAPVGSPRREGGIEWVSRARVYVFDGRTWLFALYLAGLIAALARREWDLLVFYAGINLTSFFLAATPRIFFDPRLFLHYVPFACLFPPMALMLWPAIRDARQWWRERSAGGRKIKLNDEKKSDKSETHPTTGEPRRRRRGRRPGQSPGKERPA